MIDDIQIRGHKLYWLVLLLSCGILAIAMGGGLFGQSASWQLQWQYQAFQQLCHQLPDRSFWMGGQPMAVCSRCFGIYASLTISWIFVPPLASQLKININGNTVLLIVAILCNAIDVVGSIFGFWENTLFSRLFLGTAVGLAVTLFLIGHFINDTKITKGYRYGYNRAI